MAGGIAEGIVDFFLIYLLLTPCEDLGMRPRTKVYNCQIVQVLNLCLMFTFLIVAHVSFVHTGELTGIALGRTMLLLMTLLWLLLAIEQIFFFKLKRPLSILLMSLLIIGAGLYAYPWLTAIERTT